MKTTWLGLLLLGLLAGVSTSSANDFKPYIGLAAGTFNLKYTQNKPQGTVGTNKWTWGTFLKAGVNYRDYIGLELRSGLTGRVSEIIPANAVGNARPVNLSIGADGFFSYLIKPQYPIADLYKVYGVFGGTVARFRVRGSSGVGLVSSTWKSGFTYGLGMEYKFRLKGSLAIEWVEYWSDVPMWIGARTTSKASIRGVSVMVN